jgi:hypothetical protein
LPIFFSCHKPEEEEMLEEIELLNPEGALPSLFSVSADRKVWFSKGNLQYQPFSRIWRFAEEQFSLVCESDVVLSPNYIGWIDLFGWGTSGFCGKHPLMVSEDDEIYGDADNDIAGTSYDWGVFNPISDAGDEPNLWRTLTADEWRYLFEGRPYAYNKSGLASVDGVCGVVVLPDLCVMSEVGFTSGMSNGFATNVYSRSQWEKMERAGALFLPAAGYRNGISFNDSGITGGYWTGSCFNSVYAYDLFFGSNSVFSYFICRRSYGRSVRLVRNQY